MMGITVGTLNRDEAIEAIVELDREIDSRRNTLKCSAVLRRIRNEVSDALSASYMRPPMVPDIAARDAHDDEEMRNG